MNKHIITLILPFALLASSGAWSADSSAYERLFQENILNTPQVNGDPEKARAAADCHLMSLAVLPNRVVNPMFRTAKKKNDYQQARQIFGELIVEELSLNERRKAKIQAAMEESKSLAENCLSEVL